MIQEFLTWGRRFEERDLRFEGDGDWQTIRCQMSGVGLHPRHFGGGGSEIETSSHSALLATGGKKHMPNGQGL